MTIKTVKFHGFNKVIPENNREVKVLIIELAIFAGMMIIGAGMTKNIDTINNETMFFVEELLKIRYEESIIKLLSYSFTINCLCILICTFSGMSCFGAPVTLLILLLKGLGTGLTAGIFFSAYKITGIAYYLIVILPGAILSNASFMLHCVNSGLLSLDFLLIILEKKQSSRKNISVYLKKTIIIIALTFVSSVIDCLLVKIFAQLFIF